MKIYLKYTLLFFVAFLIPKESSAENFLGKIKAEIDTLAITIQHKQADKRYYGLAYSRAIDKYEKLVAKGFTPDSLLRNLAVSYFKIHKTVKSEALFNEIITIGEAEAMDFYYYAQSLKYNQKYEEADRWIEKYRKLSKDDTRGELQANTAQGVKKLMAQEKYRIEPAFFNSEYADFGAVKLDSQLIFTSGRRDQAIVKYEYSWKGSPYLDIFSTPFKKPIVFNHVKLLSKGINSRYHDGPVFYSPDGKEVFVTRSRFDLGLPKYSEEKENHFVLYSAKRIGTGWGELQELPFNSKEYSCGHPALSADGSTLYFASDMPGGYGGSDIYSVEKSDTGWAKPVSMGPDINTEGDEMFPFSDSEGNFYFASDGHLGLGGLDIFIASEARQGEYNVVNMGYPLNSSDDDFSFYLLDNGMEGYFASNRPGGKGDDDIYKFTILEKTSFTIPFTGVTMDEKSSDIIPYANVLMKDSEGKVLFEGKSDEKAEFKTEVVPGSKYLIHSNAEKYSEAEINWLADKDQVVDDKFYTEIPLAIIEEWGVYGLIYEKETGDGVEDVDVIITEKATGKETKLSTDKEGKFRRLLDPDTDYDIILSKEGYFIRRGEFTTKNMAPGWLDVKEFIEVEMEVIEVGKTIEIPNIYYDLAKWNIREDAAIELDRVVQFLLDNESISVELGSHTDSRGSKSYNQTLSQKRAESAVNYIVEHGISKSRITAKGYGESKLKNHCTDGIPCSEEEHQANRRTEIMIVDF